MNGDSVAFINIKLPEGALPWPILAILLIGFFAVLLVLIRRAEWFKGYAKDFPTQTTTVMAGIFGFGATLLINLCRGALGMPQMDGSEAAYTASCAFAGVGAGALAAKRFSSPEYHEGKAKVEAAKAAAAPPATPPLQMNVADGGQATVQNAPQPTAEATAAAKVPYEEDAVG